MHRLTEPKQLARDHDYLAPDRSEIRLLADGVRGGLAHCRLPAGSVSIAVEHATVEELWFVIEGSGEMWRHGADGPRVDPLRPGTSLRIEPRMRFQFRALTEDLVIVIATMPPWPGPSEAVVVADGPWR